MLPPGLRVPALLGRPPLVSLSGSLPHERRLANARAALEYLRCQTKSRQAAAALQPRVRSCWQCIQYTQLFEEQVSVGMKTPHHFAGSVPPFNDLAVLSVQ